MAVAAASLAASHAGLQGQASRRVNGRVVLGQRKGERPVAGAWVLLHRVGPDRAGPLDSMRTGSSGAYAFRYTVTGDTSAVYFASTTHDGVAYFTPPFRAAVTDTGEATIIVYDTSAGPARLKVAGHHFIIGAPQPGGSRPVGEVFELENDTTVTYVSGSSRPVWTTHIPLKATSFQVNPSGDIAPGAAQRSGADVSLYAPISPGLRQFAFTYDLASGDFPLKVPTDSGGGLMEVLVQSPEASVSGGGLSEREPVSTEGRTFHRYLAQSVAANAVVTIDVPARSASAVQTAIPIVATALVTVLLIALAIAWRRHEARRALASPTRSEQLLRQLAALDDEMEQGANWDDARRRDHAARRAELKAQLAHVLAAEESRA